MSKHRHIIGRTVENRRAKHDYTFEEKEIAGIVLQGWEIKAFLDGAAQVTGSHVIFKNGEVFLVGASFTASAASGAHETTTVSRKLLMTKKQIKKWSGRVKESGYTAVLVDMHYSENKKVKVTVALAKGKKEYDKRQAEKERDLDRERDYLISK